MSDVKKKNKIRKVSISERIWIVIESIFFVDGIVLLVLGIVSDYLPVKYSENVLANAEQSWIDFSHTPLTFRALGIIAIVVAAFLSAITLNHFAKKKDVDEERELRRAQRLQVLNGESENVKEVPNEPVEQ